MWIAALVVSVICVAGLSYALVTDWDTKPVRRPERAAQEQQLRRGDSGFYLGLGIGLGAGILLASVVALRKRG